jgi:hypothetical protein
VPLAGESFRRQVGNDAADNGQVSDAAGTDVGAPRWRAPTFFGVVFLVSRGLLLWLVVPITVGWWLVGWPYWNRRGVGCWQLVGWADLNLSAGLMRSVFRPVVSGRLPWVPLSDAAHVVHRVGVADPV